MAVGLPHDTGGWTEMHLFYIHYSIEGKTKNGLSDCIGLFEHCVLATGIQAKKKKKHNLKLIVNISPDVTTTALIRRLHNKLGAFLLIELCDNLLHSPSSCFIRTPDSNKALISHLIGRGPLYLVLKHKEQPDVQRLLQWGNVKSNKDGSCTSSCVMFGPILK